MARLANSEDAQSPRERLLAVEGSVEGELRSGPHERQVSAQSTCGELALEEELAALEAKEEDAAKRLQQLDALWERRRQPLVKEVEQVRDEKQRLADRIAAAKRATNEMPPAPGPHALAWVDSTVFAIVCNVVVFLNLLGMIFGPRYPQFEHALKIIDEVFLVWYTFELGVKTAYHQRNLFIGRLSVVWWNWLDLLIVVSGIVDQWLMPFFCPAEANELSGASLLKALRIFRVLRVLKLAKAFLFNDMAWTEKPPFEIFMTCVIAVNSVTMSLELDIPSLPCWPFLENAFLVIYTFELAVRIKRFGCRFFTNRSDIIWNILDFTMVVGGILDLWLLPLVAFVQKVVTGKNGEMGEGFAGILRLLKMMRILRVLRLVRLLRAVKPLYRLLTGVMEALTAMKWVMVLTVLVLYAGAIIWTTLVGKGYIYGDMDELKSDEKEDARKFFGSVPTSLFSLFKLMNGDTSVVESLTDTACGQLLFAGFMVLSNWAVLAILTSVVSDNMMTSSAKAAEEDEKQAQLAERAQRVERLRSLFSENDRDGSGRINENQWQFLIKDPTLGEELADAAGLPKRIAQDMFDCMAQPGPNGEKVLMYEDFIENLDEAATPADNRTVMHLGSQLRDVQHSIEQMATEMNQLRDLRALLSRLNGSNIGL